jgi:hypothetical protein
MDQCGSATYVVQSAFTVRMDGGNNHAAQNSKKVRPTIESCMISAAVTVSIVVGYAKFNVMAVAQRRSWFFFRGKGYQMCCMLFLLPPQLWDWRTNKQ